MSRQTSMQIRHGQSVISVFDGVVPLHAAAAGGSVVVVLYLIDQGADVNVPRLPRRYSNEKKSDTGVLIVGSCGSNPVRNREAFVGRPWAGGVAAHAGSRPISLT
ncbi:hypothetical protein BD410DRAFT_807554 [Rickenella mellea]|uniref:Uncharacterized protein n=1 Tax=Rickenella mellea TaxID=50990 RepID=A0A4Y7PQK1_9AGAM|nr:hypothetical protein BD410DRAFT_807554 [Rickenella mellea]